MTAPNAAGAAQIAAADPDANVWLVANAGSGKTKVLTDRVARLLLRGVDPQNILCLTYTKAAAAEMQNRLFRRLGAWAMAEDGALRGNLADLGEVVPDASRLRLARQLFARAIETPGGIRIQTIHSFCAGLLRRFPLEAGVSPAFRELDDRSATLLRAEILDTMAEGHEVRLLDAVLPEVGEAVDGFLAQVAARRADLARMPGDAALRQAFGVPLALDEAALLGQVLGPGDAALLAGLVAPLLAGSATDQAAGRTLALLPATPDLAALERLEGVFLTKTGENAGQPKLERFPTKSTRAALGDRLAHLHALMGRVADARPLRLAFQAYRKAEALHRFAAAFLARYEAAKAVQGWLDFDDFITRASALLADPGTAPWVLYRLDGSIDHVLVDEAQDTSPAQWRIVAALTEEFTAGLGARPVPRSLFVVGDKKQSIYSFQGADVVGFDRVKTDFASRFDAVGAPLGQGELVHSFRSAPAILDLVDRAFPGTLEVALGGPFRHRAFHDAMPGRVDIWPVVPKPERPEAGDWFDPVDMQGETDAPIVLARQIAAEIRRMLQAGEQIPDKDGFRPVRPGDFLILVQRRQALFEALIRACKAEGLPISGPDRLTLTEELAVRDILALLTFLNTPEDDLALATALRSPLFGWSEQRLFALAQPRKGYLWEALRAADEVETLAMLNDLRRWTEYLRPFELIDRILTRHGGRERLLGRMGEEAADALDELCQQALAYERAEVPSLTGFLVWMAAGEVEVKRQAEGEGQVIRVMTVHGAKGLEAPVVILPETADRDLSREKDLILPLSAGLATWAGRKAEDPPAVAALKAARALLREAENLRLLYVAMTRAKCWLIIAAAGEASESSWHGILSNAIAGMPTTALGEGRLRHQSGDWPDPAPQGVPPILPDDLPPWLGHAAPPPPPQPATRSPSDLGGEKIVPATMADPAAGADAAETPSDGARARGTLLHLLLQHLSGLPAADRAALAQRLRAPEDLLSEAVAILDEPALGWIFGPESLAEVEIAAPWQGAVLDGAIDRLVVLPDRVIAIDFKSNAVLPAGADQVPEAYLRQLGAYAHALAAIYPGRRIETAILWTRGPVLMPLPPANVTAALLRAGPA
ncbi:MAG: double-strand break repair helicase AddA [Rhodobacteraceae bacterium]|jgi:ATP-dependent helicase/nuclease subunit A|nr:double-strand break repair helicase AddA [Paracoccaceae bacterium]